MFQKKKQKLSRKINKAIVIRKDPVPLYQRVKKHDQSTIYFVITN